MGANKKSIKLSRKEARKAKRQEKKHKNAPKPKRSAGPLQEALNKRLETQVPNLSVKYKGKNESLYT